MNIPTQVADGFDSDGSLAVVTDQDDVGADTLCDIAAGSALTAGKRVGVGIRPILADESLGKLDCEGAPSMI